MTCYIAPNVIGSDGPWSKPCNSIGNTYPACCALGERPDIGTDVCLPNGLCQNYNQFNGKNVTGYWRPYCSDPSWESPYCLKDVCRGIEDRSVQKCPDGLYCCIATEDATCCSNPMVRKFALPDLNVQASSTLSSSAPTSSSQVDTSTPTPPPPPPSSSSSSQGGLSTGAKAGIGAGAALGAIALVAILLLLWRRNRSRVVQEQYDPGNEMEAPAAAGRSGDGLVKYALETGPGGRDIGELQGTPRATELPASEYRG